MNQSIYFVKGQLQKQSYACSGYPFQFRHDGYNLVQVFYSYTTTYLQALVAITEGLYQRVWWSSVASKNAIVDRAQRVRVATDYIHKVTKEGPPVNHSSGMTHSNNSMNGHTVVQIQEECQLLIMGQTPKLHSL